MNLKVPPKKALLPNVQFEWKKGVGTRESQSPSGGICLLKKG